MTLPTILAVAVIVSVPVNWYVTWRLWRLSRSRPALWSLRAQAVGALVLAIIVTIFAFVFVNNDMTVPFLDPEQTRVLTRAGMLALSIPGLFWLYLVRKA